MVMLEYLLVSFSHLNYHNLEEENLCIKFKKKYCFQNALLYLSNFYIGSQIFVDSISDLFVYPTTCARQNFMSSNEFDATAAACADTSSSSASYDPAETASVASVESMKKPSLPKPLRSVASYISNL